MPPTPAKNLLDRVLDVVFGKKLEGEEAERARALAARLPRWASTIYFFLLWASVLLAGALLAWHWGWIPFLDSRIDSIWSVAAVGVNVVLRLAWEQISSRHARRAEASVSSKVTPSE